MDGNTFYFDWEITLIKLIQQHMGPVCEALFSFFSLFGEELFLIIVFGFMYWCISKRHAKIMGTGLLLILIANPMIKNVALRKRPYFVDPDIKCLKPVNSKADIYDVSAQGYSFPSAHAADSSAVYMYLLRILKHPLFRFAMVAITVLVGISRFSIGVHYPTDILVGWALGISGMAVMTYLQSRIKNTNLFRLILFLLSMTGIFFCRTDDYFTGLGMMGGFFLGAVFEERYVSFSETKRPLSCFIRTAGGIASYMVLNTLLKLPFSTDFLSSDTLPAFLVRSARYLIIVFFLFGVYPMLFAPLDKMLYRKDS